MWQNISWLVCCAARGLGLYANAKNQRRHEFKLRTGEISGWINSDGETKGGR